MVTNWSCSLAQFFSLVMNVIVKLVKKCRWNVTLLQVKAKVWSVALLYCHEKHVIHK